MELNLISYSRDPVGTIFEPFFRRFEAFEYVIICLIKLIDNIKFILNPIFTLT
jgi:hypothetical protein